MFCRAVLVLSLITSCTIRVWASFANISIFLQSSGLFRALQTPLYKCLGEQDQERIA